MFVSFTCRDGKQATVNRNFVEAVYPHWQGMLVLVTSSGLLFEPDSTLKEVEWALSEASNRDIVKLGEK